MVIIKTNLLGLSIFWKFLLMLFQHAKHCSAVTANNFEIIFIIVHWLSVFVDISRLHIRLQSGVLIYFWSSVFHSVACPLLNFGVWTRSAFLSM